MSEALTLEEIENRISEIYAFFSQVAPGVTPRSDVGELGVLWALFDRMVA